MRKSKYPYIVRRKCEQCSHGSKERIFKLGQFMLIRVYICTKCGFWQDARSFIENE